MATRKSSKPELTEVAAADDMLMLDFIQHAKLRHPRLRFRSKGEHAADHRLFQEHLEHIHTDMIETTEEEGKE